MTTPEREPGERRPQLDRPPSERYGAAPSSDDDASSFDARLVPVAVVLATAIAFVVLGAILLVTAGLIVVAALVGWLTGRLTSPPSRAAVLALVAVLVGFLGIWLFGRVEGGVLNPVEYLAEVEGPIVVVLSLLAAAGLAAGAAR